MCGVDSGSGIYDDDDGKEKIERKMNGKKNNFL